jgi:glutaredoxin 3
MSYTVITRNQCNFCDTAKALLKGANQSYVEYNVQSESSKWVLSLMKQAGLKTVPQIFSSDGTHIGGYTELKEFLGKVEGSVV